ncbi:MAG: amidohydrolase [Gemmatimonadetes bacterium]|nr:amidohydrolase [Gemmatimonadota bacterium]
MTLTGRARRVIPALAFAALAAAPAMLRAQAADSARIARLKAEVAKEIDGKSKMVQEIVDQLFSYGELGMQEFESSKFTAELLEKQGFKVERGVGGLPTAWVARWGSGKPVISLGADLDGIPQSSQKPATAAREWMVTGAPGHGEGHNAGQAVNIVAALAVKKIMERDKIPGTLVLWTGIAEEQMAGKAFLVRAGVFKDVDVTLYSHVGSNFGTMMGQSPLVALISAEFKFKGQSAHAAGAPWRGRSALDAAMLMGMGWEYKREHLELSQKSHYIIKDGGDQPNVVPSTASIWFYFRERDYEKTMALFETAKRIAAGAALMTDTKLDTVVMIGSGWAPYLSKPIAQAAYENIKAVGLPQWDEKDQAMAKGVQRMLGQPDSGLATKPTPLFESPMGNSGGSGSDDVGDISWNVPTIFMMFPSNIPGTPGHNWADGIAMGTPIAHKGAVAGAKVHAMTMIDILLTPKLVADAWDYFHNVQTKTIKYKPFISPSDQPPTYLNATIMARYRDEMRKYYYDPKKYKSYLEQLGIPYPNIPDSLKVAPKVVP